MLIPYEGAGYVEEVEALFSSCLRVRCVSRARRNCSERVRHPRDGVIPRGCNMVYYRASNTGMSGELGETERCYERAALARGGVSRGGSLSLLRKH